MVSLNTRKSQTQAKLTELESFPMRLHVSREVHQGDDGVETTSGLGWSGVSEDVSSC